MTARSATLQAKATLAHLGKHSDQVIQTQKKSKKLLRIRSGLTALTAVAGVMSIIKQRVSQITFFKSQELFLWIKKLYSLHYNKIKV